MTKPCPPMPKLHYRREKCHKCGAVNEKEAETKCRPTSDHNGERYCGAEFDAEGLAVAPTIDSLSAMDFWIDAHHACDRDEGCAVNGEHTGTDLKDG